MTREFAETLSVSELRTMARSEFGGGTWIACASKGTLVSALVDGNIPAAPAATPAAPAATPAASDTLADVLAAAIASRLPPQQATLDIAAVQKIAEDVALQACEMTAAALREELRPIVTLRVQAADGTTRTIDGMTHRQFPQVLAWLVADIPVWLWGAPGAGKTHLARQLAQALGIEPYVMSIDETTTANKLLGFQNLVSGEYVPGWLYRPYRDGGLVMIDEIDTGNPGVIAGLNALLSNGHYMFPNGETVTKHPMFRVVAAANTNGTGAVAGFTARQRLDAATLNRFAQVEFRYDDSLEMSLACGMPYDGTLWHGCAPADETTCQAWVRWIQAVRASYGHAVLVSPRASLLGVRALRSGIPVPEVADALVLALCSADTRRAMVERYPLPDAMSSREKVA